MSSCFFARSEGKTKFSASFAYLTTNSLILSVRISLGKKSLKMLANFKCNLSAIKNIRSSISFFITGKFSIFLVIGLILLASYSLLSSNPTIKPWRYLLPNGTITLSPTSTSMSSGMLYSKTLSSAFASWSIIIFANKNLLPKKIILPSN